MRYTGVFSFLLPPVPDDAKNHTQIEVFLRVPPSDYMQIHIYDINQTCIFSGVWRVDYLSGEQGS